MGILRHLPNFLTTLNVLCGSLATVFAINGQLKTAIFLIFAGALFDFMDGFAARALKAYSAIGKELDSLADLISFGIAPAALWSSIIRLKVMGEFQTPFYSLETPEQFWILSPFILVAFAALRLAKFNVDTRQTENFLGLTTTATGIFTAAFTYLFMQQPQWFEWLAPIVVLIMILFFSLLLVSEVPMFSLKFKTLKWQDNKERFLLLIIALVSIALLGIGGIAATILCYILFSMIKWAFSKKATI